MFSLQTMKPDQLAEHISVLGSRMFCSIPYPEVILWSKQHHPEDAPRLFNFIGWSKMLTRWCISEILLAGSDPAQRATLVARAIQVAVKCRSMNDFNGGMSILCALHSPAIARLDKTWNGLCVCVCVWACMIIVCVYFVCTYEAVFFFACMCMGVIQPPHSSPYFSLKQCVSTPYSLECVCVADDLFLCVCVFFLSILPATTLFYFICSFGAESSEAVQ
jgi:RasGEF domain